MEDIDRATLTWKKSSRSEHENCVEMAVAGPWIFLRDSKNPDGEVLVFSRDSWTAFLADIPLPGSVSPHDS